MTKLTKEQADRILEKASSLSTMQSYGLGYRLGQAIFNLLPMELYNALAGTPEDFFYERDESVVIHKFYAHCVESN